MRAIVRLAYEATCAFVPLVVVAIAERRGRGGNFRGEGVARHHNGGTPQENGAARQVSFRGGGRARMNGKTSQEPFRAGGHARMNGKTSQEHLHAGEHARSQRPSRWRRVAHGLGVAVFAVYLLLVMWICGVGTFWDFVRGGAAGWQSQVNLQPFSPYLNPVTWALNVVLFVPLGFLLPCLWREYDRFVPTLAFGFCFSLAIELSQLLNFRITDVDDLIANTLGAVVGLALYWLLRRLFPKAFARALKTPTHEPVLYAAAMFLGIFFLYGARGHAEMRIVSWLDAL